MSERTPAKTVPAIECLGIGKRYRGGSLVHRRTVSALDGVSFEVPVGRTVGLIGPNGAGKTTLMALIAGLLRPNAGEIRVCGHKAGTLDARRCIRYMPEAPTFLDTYTGRQTLEYHAALVGMSRKEALAEADRLAALTGLREAADRNTGAYSQGMKQRLGLAVALLGHPRVLLLDEPSNGLDPPGVIRLREVLTQQARRGVTVLISSHRLAELERLTPHFIYLNKGRVVQPEDRPEEDAGERVRIDFLAGGPAVNGLADAWEVIEKSETHLVVRVAERNEIPEVVRALAAAGLPIVGVATQREDLEEAFMRLYSGGE